MSLGRTFMIARLTASFVSGATAPAKRQLSAELLTAQRLCRGHAPPSTIRVAGLSSLINSAASSRQQRAAPPSSVSSEFSAEGLVTARWTYHPARRRTFWHTAWLRAESSRPQEKSDSRSTRTGLDEKTEPTSQRTMLDGLPSLQRLQRQTKEELLAAATGFWSRLRVHFKWFSIRSVRPFNIDDISAFFSWILLGHVIWVIVGTTTFFSLIILAVNTVFAQETLARWVGSYLTKSSGVQVIFESAIVPKWKDGVITFKNVFVSRRPGQAQSNVRKGSQIAAAAAAAELASERAVVDDEDTNYTQFDLSIDTINVTLSFAKWFNGHGLLRDVEVKGIRGVVDRTAVYWLDEDVDPRSWRHESDTGDFEIESFKMEDLLVSVYQPGNFRPFSVSIYSADLPQLRKQWLFYDFLAANNVSGSFDGSLFTIHPRQRHNHIGTYSDNTIEDGENWKKQSRLRIDGLRIDHLNRGIEGPFSWIHEGNVDIVADILFPADTDESIAKVVSDFYDRVEAQVLQQRGATQAEGSRTYDAIAQVPDVTAQETTRKQPPVIFDLTLTLTSVHATVPLFTRDLSYVNSALIRPIVAYINSQSNPSLGAGAKHKQVTIPINCRVIKPLDDFEGSWTIYDSGLMQDLSRETYDAFARGVADQETRVRRMRKVGVWGLQMVVQALVLGLAGQIA